MIEIKEPENVICFEAKKKDYGRKYCTHKYVLIDPDLEYVQCRDCGEKLNPMQVLYRAATEETRLYYRIKEMHKWEKKYKEKSRVKCQHCNKMTPVRVK